MIIRIVRLSFQPEKVDAFIELFEKTRNQIAAFDGCHEVKLLRDVDTPHVFFTHSKWESVEKLNSYRQSQLFETTWNSTKILFNDKPFAWSLTDTGK